MTLVIFVKQNNCISRISFHLLLWWDECLEYASTDHYSLIYFLNQYGSKLPPPFLPSSISSDPIIKVTTYCFI